MNAEEDGVEFTFFLFLLSGKGDLREEVVGVFFILVFFFF